VSIMASSFLSQYRSMIFSSSTEGTPPFLFRAYLRAGEMTSSEGFLFWANHFSAGILDVFQGKMVRHRAKRPAVWAF
ncbi:MAG TPA: hypothetical protein DIT87_01490, partial [Clostridiales bacterium]|nr:hypothetical protein [Clostridiales bacterium]